MSGEPFAFFGAVVDELARAGVRHVCLAPGSRSTPLALAAAQHPRLQVWVHLDERAAAFFAQGMARASRQPVALLCTSGTAAANFLPAVVEAWYARVPLVVLTADRPRELRGWGANQTVDQVHLYGRHVKWFADLAEPGAAPERLRYARATVGRAVALARAEPAGPVHLNLPVPEPLVPEGGRIPPPAAEARAGDAPYLRVWPAAPAPADEAVAALAARLRAARRPVVVCGAQPDPDLAAPLAALAAARGWPVLADALSGLRCGTHPLAAVIAAYDLVLRHPAAREALRPDLVLRLGALPASRALQAYLDRHRDVPQVVVDPGPDWPDPLHAAWEVVPAAPRAVVTSLAERLDAAAAADPAWLARWQRLERAAREAAAAALADLPRPAEARLFPELAALLPDGATVYAGNSMPVRDLEAFLPALPRRLRFLANRGASGIDGVVSSALGAAAVADGPVVAVVGDLSLYHDLNGLAAARRFGLTATVVLVHNDGGGIFSFLPQAERAERHEFERLFGTPHGLDFRPAVEALGGRLLAAPDWEAFRRAVAAGLRGEGLTVVEVRSDRDRNAEEHRAAWQAAVAAVERALAEEGLPAAGGEPEAARGTAGPARG